MMRCVLFGLRLHLIDQIFNSPLVKAYRQSYQFRYELIVMRDKARDTLEGDVEVDANIIDFRFKWFF